ncbi:DNA-processing protein DprA [Salinibacterium sp. UTAS2018]|uniref:DNA-processing protein DprA n=1 Tax=Salinibacterium sp. UTAS2018 TaxID=2508880 RepID=UPI00210FBB8C|nr:DNA-processing protein DprA [Salinibacterium sp. UTAS2018]
MTCGGGRVLTPRDMHWPSQVSALGRGAPLVLFAQGDVTTLRLPSVAITGTTAPNTHETHMTIELATGLADRRWVIASGMAQGIDQLSLSAATAMRGRTIIVGAEMLRDTEVVHDSVRVSELPLTKAVTAREQHRSRLLLAAIATKTIVVETGESSNAFLAAEAAIAIHRPVGILAQASMKKPGAERIDPHSRRSMVRIASVTDADRLR